MSILQAIILGIVQGFTEFLPVSSSGHLVIFQNLFGLTEPELLFNVSVHFGTILAVLIIFYKDIKRIIFSCFNAVSDLLRGKMAFKQVFENPDVKLALLIIAGSVPTAVIGLFFNEIAHQLFSSLFLVGCMLIITGLILFTTCFIKEGDKDISQFTFKSAILIGVVQGLAIIPGISRSGSTICTGLFSGLNRRTAARFSFLLSIPAVLGAEVLSLKDAASNGIALDAAIIVGTVTSFIVGYASLKMLLFIINKGKLHYFAPYCFMAGITVFFIS